MRHRENDTVDNRWKDEQDIFYSSWKWRKCKNGYLNSVGGLCEQCRQRGVITPAEEVHHKKHLTKANISKPEIALCWDNLIALCIDCHKEMHRKTKRWRVDADGNVTAAGPP